MKTTRLATTVLLIGALAACSSNKTANEGNFTTAIDDYLAHHGSYANVCIRSVALPYTVQVYQGTETAFGLDAEKREILVELIDAGLLRQETKTQTFGSAPFASSQTSHVYDTTPFGHSLVSSNTAFGGSVFCFATIKVGKIVNCTTPQNLYSWGSDTGMTGSQVTWIPAIASVSPWAQQLIAANKLQRACRLMDQASSAELTQALVLESNGWEAQAAPSGMPESVWPTLSL